MQWTQLCVHGTLSDRDTICAILCMLDENIVLEDYSDIDMKTVYADLIDEKILHADKNNITASIYVSEDKPLGEYISFLKDRFRIAHIDAQITCNGVKEEELPEFAKSVIENQQRLMKHSFVPLDYDKVYGIYKKLY